MPRQSSPDFVEALARGLDIITAFSPTATALSVSDVAARTSLPRPTARRLLMTLEQLGYVRSNDGAVHAHDQGARARDDVHRRARHLGAGPAAPRGAGRADRRVELDVAARRQRHRVRGPGAGAEDHRPRRSTSAPGSPPWRRRWATCCWPTSPTAELLRGAPRRPSQSGIIPRIGAVADASWSGSSATVRERGWALSDERLSLGIRSVAAPVRDASGATVAAVNVTVHAAETSVAELKRRHLPLLLATADAITEEWANLARLPVPDPLAPTITGATRAARWAGHRLLCRPAMNARPSRTARAAERTASRSAVELASRRADAAPPALVAHGPRAARRRSGRQHQPRRAAGRPRQRTSDGRRRGRPPPPGGRRSCGTRHERVPSVTAPPRWRLARTRRRPRSR